MADTSRVVVTGVTGPGKTIAANTTYQRVANVDIDFQNQVLTIYFVDQNKGPLSVDIAADTTLTLTVTSGVYTLTVAA